jgi:sugar phosphate isomerase/epimerase
MAAIADQGEAFMQLGLTTRTFGPVAVEDSARLAAQAGVDGVQLAIQGVPAVSDLAPLTPEACRSIRQGYEARGLQVYAVDAYVPAGSADPEGASDAAEHIRALMPLARHLGTSILAASAGPRGINAYEQALLALRALMPLAHEQDVIIALEPSYDSLACCAEKVRALIEEVGYNRLKVLIDPARLLVYDSLDRMFSLLGQFILFGHASDVLVDKGGNPTFVRAGQGQLDYRHYLDLLLAHGVDVLIVEDVTQDTLLPTLDYLRSVIAQVEEAGG